MASSALRPLSEVLLSKSRFTAHPLIFVNMLFPPLLPDFAGIGLV